MAVMGFAYSPGTGGEHLASECHLLQHSPLQTSPAQKLQKEGGREKMEK